MSKTGRANLPIRERLFAVMPWCAALSLLAGALITTYRAPHMWFDEVCTLLTISDPSLTHMIRAMAEGAETSPPLYHLLARGWGMAFGFDQRPLRIFSALGFVGAVFVTSSLLRRYYSSRATAFAVVVSMAGSSLLIQYTTQLRFYGLFFFLATAALSVACLVMRSSEDVSNRRWIVSLVGFAGLLAALLYTHVFGIVYAGALSAAVIVHDVLVRRRIRPGPVIAMAGAAISFVPWLPAFATQRAVAASGLWISRPGPRTVLHAYEFEVQGLAISIMLLIAAAIAAKQDGARPLDSGARVSATPIRIAALSLLAVPLLIAAASYITVPLFWPRYMLPSLLGLTVILAEACDGLGVGRGEIKYTPSSVVSDAFLLAACGLGLFLPAFTGRRTDRTTQPDIAVRSAVDSSVRDLPIALESNLEYVPMWYYGGRVAGRYAFIADSAAAADPAAAPGQLAEIRLARAWKRAGYSPDIVEPEEYLASATEFLVVDFKFRRFFERRIARNPRWVHCRVGSYQEAAIQLVVRQGTKLRGCLPE